MAMTKNVEICNFCNKEEKLIKSHIIPKKFYTNRLKFSNKDFLWCADPDKTHDKRNRTGIYDENILCGNCDR